MKSVWLKSGLHDKRFNDMWKVDFNKRWPVKQQLLFFKTLADLLHAGFSLQQAVADIVILLPQQKKICDRIANTFARGGTFCASLKHLLDKETFNQLYIAESYGLLYESVRQLSNFLEQKEQQRQRLRAVLLYPIFLLLLITVLIIAFQVFLKPELSAFQTSSNLNLSSSNYSFFGLLGIIGGSSLGLLVVYKKYFGSKHHGYLQRVEQRCRFPFLGGLYRMYCYYYISFNLALLLKSGLDLKKICVFLSEFEHETLLFHMGEELKQVLKKGQEMDQFISHYSFIPQEFTLFLSKGNTVDELSNELMIYAQAVYVKLLQRIERLIGLVQPLLFVVVALLIIITYLSMLLPLYQNLGGMYQ
ncbi:type II secretion system F family protein [Liquorilactobacillus satsumensis]|nr:type II secretion system F family protein [Liquorilactobacillus satsumensis]MCC7667394.1 competence protein ComG [Liquorilactobacillus satsumensis]MCP9313253.1 type II secretion system F family protein [Liquorilactobacillus satsumensis]MCP9358610.1 type II secretion system F family protein [Liquorilactobacillus satsumensis]MCP9360386.1 type II secretion system F family protein [Liquorilactobacillus satsumensis]MCP9371762.1 type II secretion system F family protein [Liquorilactobacillus sats